MTAQTTSTVRYVWEVADPVRDADGPRPNFAFDVVSRSTVRETIEAWRKRYQNCIPVGTSMCLTLPTGEQQGVLVDRHYYPTAEDERKGRLHYVLMVDCVVCDECFEKIVRANFNDVPRTCEVHRGQWRPARIMPTKPSPITDAVRAAVERYRLVADSVAVDEVIAAAVGVLPDGPNTRQVVRRALNSLASKSDVGFAIREGLVTFSG